MKIHNNLALGLIVSALLSQTAQAQSSALFGLYQAAANDNRVVTILENNTQGCVLRREGKTTGTQGDYKLAQVNRFFLLECQQAQLVQLSSQALITELDDSSENLMLVEGPMLKFTGLALQQPGAERSYIFKLSDYNNLTPQQRRGDVKKLSAQAQQRQYHYSTEAFIRINDAFGIARPDELVVLYYRSEAEGQKFRQQNLGLMRQVGEFNQRHLTKYSYIGAQSNL
ncbi:MAG: hypothetical protein MJK10_18990 [Pseudomonadales bacterium]|nr:hypothetical protein [Pseudomonadales bacterium]NRA18373.1 hypothetical protein [Oceanospirillaceae bacterium]